MNYFDLPGISSSLIKTFRKDYFGVEPLENLQDIFDNGSLLDGLLTDRWLVSFKDRAIIREDSGERRIFSTHDWERGLAMKQAFINHDLCNTIRNTFTHQYTFLRKKFPFTWEGDTVYGPVKCKFDFHFKLGKKAADLKSTGLKSKTQFIKSIPHFNYDMSGAFYMDIARIDHFMFLAVSKHYPHDIFVFNMHREDELYRQGRRKYNEWGYKYLQLIDSFI